MSLSKDELKKACRFNTGVVRLAFPKVFKAESREPGEKVRFSVRIDIPKTDKVTLGKIKQATQAAKELGALTKWGGEIPAKMKPSVFKDGDDPTQTDLKKSPELAGHYYAVVSTGEAFPPGVVDRQRRRITDESEIYPGVFARVAIAMSPYSHETGGNGVGAYLNGVQKWADGEVLGGGVRAEDAFNDDFEDDSYDSPDDDDSFM